MQACNNLGEYSLLLYRRPWRECGARPRPGGRTAPAPPRQASQDSEISDRTEVQTITGAIASVRTP